MEIINSKNTNWLSELGVINIKEEKKENSEEESKITWISDSLTTHCHDCNSKFSTILVRRHHCRICGNAFCNSCINKVLQVKTKQIKVCKKCYENCQEFIQAIIKRLINERNSSLIEMKESFYCRTFEQYLQTGRNFLEFEEEKFEDQLKISINENYDLIIKTLINYVLNINFNEEIVNEWNNKIYILVKEAISNVRPCSRFLNDSLDINEYIEIFTLPFKDHSMCQVIQGFALLLKKKEVLNLNKSINNPKIILIDSENINNEKEETGLGNSIEVRKAYTNIIEKKLLLINPDIVLVGENTSLNVKDIVKSENLKDIIFITNINKKELEKISRCIQTIPIPSFDLIGSNNILGRCKNFYFEKSKEDKSNSNDKKEILENDKISFNEEYKVNEKNKNYNKKDDNKENNINEDNNANKDDNENKNNYKKKENNEEEDNNDLILLVFDGCNEILFNSIILSGEDEELLNKLKIMLKQIILPTVRDLFLQKFLQYTFNMKISPSPKDKEYEKEVQKVEELLNENKETMPMRIDLERELSNNDLSLGFKDNNMEEINSSERKKNLLSLFYKNFDMTVVEKEEDFNIYYLTKITMSQKIKKNWANDEENASKSKEDHPSEKFIQNSVYNYCEEPNETYFSFYTGDKKYDKPLGDFILDLCIQSSSVCPSCEIGYNKHTHYLYKTNGVLKYSMISNEENNLDKITKYLLEKTNKDYSNLLTFKEDDYECSYELKNAEIYTYGYCNKCQDIVTPLFLITNEVYNYSYGKFIRYMLENHNANNQIRVKNFNIKNLISHLECEHKINKDISRIFVTRFGSWKFEYNDIIKHYMIPMNLNSNSINNGYCSTQILLFKKYLEEGNNHSMKIISRIKEQLLLEEKYFIQLLADEKLFLFFEFIGMMLSTIKSLKIQIDKFVNNIVIKHLKDEYRKYENNYIKLLVDIKKIYVNIIRIKLILNRVDHLRIYIKVISDILNCKIPLTYEENLKIIEKEKEKKDSIELEETDPDKFFININFNEDPAYKNILSLINYFDNRHDHYSCEFDPEDLSCIIANVLSSNGYLNYMKLNNGIQLTSIQCKRNPNEITQEKIRRSILSRRRGFSKYSQISGKKIIRLGSDKSKGSNKSKECDKHKEENLFDTLLVFDQSKQKFFSKDNENITNEQILETLEEQLISDNNFHLISTTVNNLYKLVCDKSYKIDNISEEKSRSVSTSNVTDNKENSNNLKKSSSQNILFKKREENNNIDKSEKKKGIEEEQKIFDYSELDLGLKEVEKQLYRNKTLFKTQRNKLINKIKKKFNKESNKTNEEKKSHSPINLIIKKNKVIQEPMFNLPPFPIEPEIIKISDLRKEHFYQEKLILKDSNEIEVIVYYPRQFESLRIAYCATIEEFIQSLSKSTEWSENTGGKSRASFLKTIDEKYVIKNVSENEFNMFVDNAKNYFAHTAQFLFYNQPSTLAKILGAYQLKIKYSNNKEEKKYLLLMENIYYGMITQTNTTFNEENSSIKIYDLKGSKVNRYIPKNLKKPNQVLLDTNFLEDFNGEPLFIISNVYKELKNALENDTEYLMKMGIMDYSLILIIDEEEAKEDDDDYYIHYFDEKKKYKLFKLGIIDFARQYTWDKHLESGWKSFIHREDPTIIKPDKYRERFLNEVCQYFVGV